MATQTNNTLLAAAANNYLYANELFLISELLKLGVDSIATAPPGSPADFNSRLIQGTGTGDFAGHNNNLALYYNGAWLYAAPVNGMRVWVKSLQCYYRYVTSAWLPDAGWSTLTDAATITVDAGAGRNFQVTLAGNRTLGNPSNLAGTNIDNDGKMFRFRIVQDATGSRTLTYASRYKFPSATPPTLSTGGGAIDVLRFVYHRATDSLLYEGAQLNLS